MIHLARRNVHYLVGGVLCMLADRPSERHARARDPVGGSVERH